MTFENVAAASRKVKSGSADRLRALVAYVCTYAMSINGRAIKTGGYASMLDGNRCEAKRANLYPLLPPLCVFSSVFLFRETDANCVNRRQLFSSAYRSYARFVTYYIYYSIHIFNLSNLSGKADTAFLAKERMNTYIPLKGNNLRSTTCARAFLSFSLSLSFFISTIINIYS